MQAELNKIREEALAEVFGAASLEQVNDIRVKYLGKKGLLTGILRGMGQLSQEERPIVGQLANDVRTAIEESLNEQMGVLKNAANNEKLSAEKIDITLPGKVLRLGKKHPLTAVLDEIKEIFLGLGYEIAEGPEIELDYYNFEALNIPPDHPARDMADSFYISDGVLLRTHTSPTQPRVMEKRAPQLPVKVIAPGKVFRRDDDATHSPMFHQVEGFLIDKNVTFAELKGTLLSFARQMFGQDREIRVRPSFFPFTEPSAEIDISCMSCGGKGCRGCAHTGWLEILGAGMIHPRVLEMSGYNPEEVSGFAFGMGVERVAMLKYNLDDLRMLYENDKRFLEQF